MSGIHSCKKVDGTQPNITFIAPLENTQFNVYDTVDVRFEVTDETQLVSADVKVVNSDLIPVSAAVSVNVSGTDYSGGAEVIIANKLLGTGNYFVLVSASDGVNEQRVYQKIRIAAIPKLRRAVYFSDAGNSGQSGIYRIDSLFQSASLFINPTQDIRELCVNSELDRLTFIGHFSTGISSYDLSKGAVVWSDATFPVSQTPRFMDLYCFGDQVFTTLYDYEIRSYTSSGSLTMNLVTESDRPQTIYADERFLIVQHDPVGTETHILKVFHAQTRAFLWQLQIPMDVVSICRSDDEKVLLFGNDGDQARVLQYEVVNNGYWQPRQLPEGKLLDAEKLDGQNYAIALENGLYFYAYSPNFMDLIRPSVYQDVCFDVAENVLIAASNNMLEEMTLSGQVVNTVFHSDSIGSIDVHYTR